MNTPKTTYNFLFSQEEYAEFKEKFETLPENRIPRDPPNHETNDLLIDGKWVKVDREIIPLVNFLNKFPTTKTQFSCHGSTADELEKYQEFRLPYVLFTSNDFDLLEKIGKLCHELNDYKDFDYRTLPNGRFTCPVWMSLSYYDGLRYFLEFRDRGVLIEFTERLLGEGNV